MIHIQTFAYVYFIYIYLFCLTITVIWTDRRIDNDGIYYCHTLYGHYWMYPSPTYKSNQKIVSLNKAPLWIFTFQVVLVSFQNHPQCTPWNISSRPCDPPLGNVQKKNGWFFLKGMSPENALIHFSGFLEKIGTFVQMFFRYFFSGKQPAQHESWVTRLGSLEVSSWSAATS